MKMMTPTPGTFAFRMPEIPDIPSMEWNGNMLFGGGSHGWALTLKISAGNLAHFSARPMAREFSFATSIRVRPRKRPA